jgi:Metallopeptidase family M24
MSTDTDTSTESTPLRHTDEQVEAFDQAQRATIRLMSQVVSELREGMSEADVVRLAEGRAGDLGFQDWFHRPEVRFDAPARLPLRASSDKKLAVGTVVEIDLAPSTTRAFGDFGYALCFGGAPEPEVLTESRQICRATVGFASRWKCTGEVYVFATAWARNRQATIEGSTVGHVCLAPTGLLATAWPRLARAAILMRRNQVEWFNHRRMSGIFAIQPRLVWKGNGLSFEEMVYVDGDHKRVLGRDRTEDMCTLPA